MAVIQAIENKRGLWDAYVSLHSYINSKTFLFERILILLFLERYGQWWLLPFGHSAAVSERPVDYQEMIEKAKIAAGNFLLLKIIFGIDKFINEFF
jgi:hypothetical protein